MTEVKKDGEKTSAENAPDETIATTDVVTEGKEDKAPQKDEKEPKKEGESEKAEKSPKKDEKAEKKSQPKAKWKAVRNFKSQGEYFQIGDPVVSPTKEVKKLNFVEKA
jgi:hypothetical protein